MSGFRGFTPKEKHAYYTGVANGKIAPKENSSVSAQSQKDYARGQRDARNEMAISYLLGKNSPLSDKQKAEMKAKIKEKNKTFREERKNKVDSKKKK